jgi:DNA-cytosine methyltransferase
MIILSLFDGMSCGQIALNKAGIKYNTYYAAEIDKHAIKVTQANYPETVQLGDVTKWKEWDIDWSIVGLLLAGSPCQGFSFAGKQLAFDDPRSALFFVFVEIWQHIKKHNPNANYLLENVKMKQEHELIISRYMGVHPIQINSALLTAQNRVRLYWTNILNEPYGLFGDMTCIIPQPKDKGVLLKDVLEKDVNEKYYLKNDKIIDFVTDKWRLDKKYTQINGDKAITQQARQYSSWCGDYVIEASRGRNPENPKSRQEGLPTEQHFRRLTPVECERLQSVPNNYTAYVSDSQRYKMLGNGWTVDVIVHILNYMK